MSAIATNLQRMGKKKNNNLEGQGFHTNPERINKKGQPHKVDLSAIFDSTPESEVKAIVDKLKARAKAGDTRAIELFFDRHSGKLKQEIALNNITVICPDDSPDLPAT